MAYISSRIMQEDRALPSREICHHYGLAMHQAQQIEENLRYILDSAEYYGIIEEFPRSKREKNANLVELIDNATCGKLFHALRKRIILDEIAWDTLEKAIKNRNFLAHKFLVQFDYEDLTESEEKKIKILIIDHFKTLYAAVKITRSLKNSLDKKTDEIDDGLKIVLKELGMEPTHDHQRKTHSRKSST